MATLFDNDVQPATSDAEISDCGLYRYSLYRSWQIWDAQGFHVRGKGVVCFVMLNPSTADASLNDPTIRRCIGFAKAWGYNTLVVRNLFPYRATDPKELLKAENPTGGIRGETALLTATSADLVIVAWGADVPFDRDVFALDLFAKHFPNKPLYCIGKTKHGKPRHPLYVRGDAQPILFKDTTDA